MRIKEEAYMEFNERKAFAALLSDLFTDCLHRFKSQIGEREGWNEMRVTEDDILNAIDKHANRITSDNEYSPPYTKVDLLDLVVYAAMLYNRMDDDEEEEEKAK